MHFKSAVILCALYFVTVTQSIGLSRMQINDIIDVFGNYKYCENELPMEKVLEITKILGLKDMSAFEFKKDMNNNQTLQDLLVFLANNDKKSDDWMFRILTSFEVQLLVSLFEAQDRMGNNDGLLEYSEVLQVIDALMLESKVRMLLKARFQEGDKTINAAEFLKGYLVAKKSGKGLDKKQVEELNNIKNHKKVDEHIDDVEITNFYKKLSIVKDEYNSLVDLKTTRTAPFVLQELMVNSSEYYYREINEKQGYVSPNASIDEGLDNLSVHNIDKNGVLGMKEPEGIAKHHCQNKDCETIQEHHNNENILLKLQDQLDILAELDIEADEEAENVSSITSIDEGLDNLSEHNTDKNGVLEMNENEGIAKRHCQNKEADENAVYTTTSVRDLLQKFADLDNNSNGGLSNTELINIVKMVSPNENVDSFIDKFDNDGNHILDILEFFGAAVKSDYILMKRYSDEESDEIDWSDESDEIDWIGECDESDESDDSDDSDESDEYDWSDDNDENVKKDEYDERYINNKTHV
ncbi:protein PFC0760c-like [Adelges cooleyi]|uniref:protein PFC0760c-like n=1 Tax=Adelges cooleyi TaxID=133065 RepID=UPI00217F6AE4|nr:protein PFC0760c-like [Adelges cooleyi]